MTDKEVFAPYLENEPTRDDVWRAFYDEQACARKADGALAYLEQFRRNNALDVEAMNYRHDMRYAPMRTMLSRHVEGQREEEVLGDLRSLNNIARNICATRDAVLRCRFGQKNARRRFFGAAVTAEDVAAARRDMIQQESDTVGSRLFGPVPEGRAREFYCLDEHTWVWNEEWFDGGQQKRVVRYEVGEGRVVKNVDGVYKKVGRGEFEHFETAAKAYYAEVMAGIYRVDPMSGRALGAAGEAFGGIETLAVA